jgi:hypothetical protein
VLSGRLPPPPDGPRSWSFVSDGLRHVLWAVGVLLALVLLLRGLTTGLVDGSAAAGSGGRLLVVGACCFLVAAAGHAVLVTGSPRAVGGALLAPVVLCGGLSVVAAGTLLPVLAAWVSFPIAVVASLDVLFPGRRRR